MPGVFSRSGTPTIVFVTVGTKNKARWLDSSVYHGLLRGIWSEASHWRVGRYVVMPDHIHFFAAEFEPDFAFEDWMKYWRSLFTRRNPVRENRLQSDCWHRRLRSNESYIEKWHYVRENPVRHGYVAQAMEWPYQGELFELDW